MLTILWIGGLFGGCIVWGLLMNTAMFGASANFQEDLGVALGIGGSVFAFTALGAGVAWAITRSRTKALWAWTILILLALAVLGIGAAQSMRMSALEGLQ